MKDNTFSAKFIWVIPAVLVCMITALFFCGMKKGYHEDEYYSFYSTARTGGLFAEDRTWMSKEEILREYTVLPGEGFRYGLVREVQSWDVHPPVYYWMLHTVESLFPGHFNKWIGLSVNLVSYFIELLLLAELAEILLQDKRMIPLAVLACGLMPAAVSAVTFIRMYAVLTVFVLWAAILHGRSLTREELTVRAFYLPLAVCTYLGFLTQYYYFVFLFFLAAGFCMYRLVTYRKIKDTACYAMTMVMVFGTAYLTYPAFPGQMFKGQRGAQATTSFFDLSNTWTRIRFFLGLVNKYAFGGALLWLFLAALVILGVTSVRSPKKMPEDFAVKPALAAMPVGLLLAFALSGYFLTVSKTGLLLGDSAIRYQMPVCGIMVLLTIWFFAGKKRLLGIFCAVLLTVLDIYGLFSGNVLFLYSEDAEKTAFAEQCAQEDIPAVYFYDNVQNWCIWDSTDELLMYPEIFFCDQSSALPVTDGRIESAKKLVVYISSLQDEQSSIDRVFDANRNVTKYGKQYQDTFCSVYLFE